MNMKRSKTTYSPSNSNSKSFGVFLGEGQRDLLEVSPRSRKTSLNDSFTSFGAANASWGQSSTCPDQTEIPQKARNIFLQNDKEISCLLGLLHSDNFTGEIDPVHHSQYMKAPKIDVVKKQRARRLGERRYHQSDSHLLHMKCKQTAVTAGQ